MLRGGLKYIFLVISFCVLRGDGRSKKKLEGFHSFLLGEEAKLFYLFLRSKKMLRGSKIFVFGWGHFFFKFFFYLNLIIYLFLQSKNFF